MTLLSVAADAEGGDFELCLAEAGGLPTLIPAPALQQRLDFRCRFPPSPAPPAEPLPAVVVHLHIHYLELAPPLLAALARCLPALQPFSLLVSTTSSQRAADLGPVLEASAAAKAATALELVVTRNIGRNLGPLLVELWPRLREAPLLLHLHGKRSPQNRLGGPWLEGLLATLLPGPQEVAALRASFQQHPDLGLLIPEAPEELRSFLNWGNNFELASLLADWHPEGLPLSRLAPLVFPAGMMLWCRPAALQPLARQLTQQGNLPLEPLRVDGTSLHAAERLVVHSCEAVRLDWALIASQAPRSGLTPARFSVWKPEEELFLQATAQWLHRARQQSRERASQAGADSPGEEQALRKSLVQAEEVCARLQADCQSLEWQRLQAEVESQSAQACHRSDQEVIAALQQQLEQQRAALQQTEEQWQATRQEREELGAQIEAARQGLHRLQEERQQEKQGLQQELQKLQHNHQDLQQAKERLQQENEGLRQELQRQQQGLQQGQQALQGLQREHQELLQKHQGLQEEHQGLQKKHQGLQEEHQGLQQKHQGLQEEHQGLQQKHQGLQEEHQGLQQKHQGLQEEQQGLQQKHQGLQKEQQGLQEEQQGLRQELQRQQQGLQQGQQALQRLQAMHQALHQDKEALQKENEGLQQELQRQQQALHRLQEEHQGLQQKHQGLQQEKQGLQQELLQKQQVLQQGQQALQVLQQEAERLQNQQSLTGEALSGVRAELESSQTDRQQEQWARQGAELRLAVLEGSRTWRWRRRLQGWLGRPPG